MRFAFYMNIVSPHQLPLAGELAMRVGVANFRYIYQHLTDGERTIMGWSSNAPAWSLPQNTDEAREWLEKADVLVCGLRELELFERRSQNGLRTYYTSERWFKPIPFFGGRLSVTGIIRMLAPNYRRMANRIVRLLKNDQNFFYLPAGVWAKKDMLRLGVPENKLIIWGYFVAPSSLDTNHQPLTTNSLRVLWVGRMLKLKNVDTIIRAVAQTAKTGGVKVELTLVGDGPEKSKLMKLASSLTTNHQPPITFHPSVKIDQVRELMREHDVYVFPSNALDGWGAVVSEAMEEGMLVLGSNQAGASATMLPESHRFDCCDWLRLSELLRQAAEGKLEHIPIGEWSAKHAAERLLSLCQAKESMDA